MEIVINKCYGGFGLSEKAMRLYAEYKGLTLYKEGNSLCELYYTVPPEQRTPSLPEPWMSNSTEDRIAHNEAISKEMLSDRDISRDDPDLIRVVKKLGSDANGKYSKLEIVEIPDNVKWIIEEYDGNEWIAEAHRTWG